MPGDDLGLGGGGGPIERLMQLVVQLIVLAVLLYALYEVVVILVF